MRENKIIGTACTQHTPSGLGLEATPTATAHVPGYYDWKLHTSKTKTISSLKVSQQKTKTESRAQKPISSAQICVNFDE